MIIRSYPVNAFLDYGDVAVASAEKGPLRGLTFAVKDVFDVAGYPTGVGNPVLLAESPVHKTSAPIVQAMLDAGAEFVGKTQTSELAFAMFGSSKHFPAPINIRAPGRHTGGSSTGSVAAVAAGLCDFALGSDTGGSVRGPASYCGLWGIRPSHGRVDNSRAFSLAPSLDVAGYFADEPGVFSRVAPAFLGDDARPFALTRLIRADDAFARLASEREAAALGPAAARVEARLGAAQRVTLAPGGLEAWGRALLVHHAVEAWAAHGAWIESRNPDLTPGTRERFEEGKDVDADTLRRADAVREEARGRLESLLLDDGVLMLPTVPAVAPRLDFGGEALKSYRLRAHCMLCNSGLSGMPQVTMPIASLDGMPLGLSLIGPRGSDRALVALAIAVAES